MGDKNKGKVQLDKKKHIFRPIWSIGAGDYLWGVKYCGLSITQKCN